MDDLSARDGKSSDNPFRVDMWRRTRLRATHTCLSALSRPLTVAKKNKAKQKQSKKMGENWRVNTTGPGDIPAGVREKRGVIDGRHSHLWPPSPLRSLAGGAVTAGRRRSHRDALLLGGAPTHTRIHVRGTTSTTTQRKRGGGENTHAHTHERTHVPASKQSTGVWPYSGRRRGKRSMGSSLSAVDGRWWRRNKKRDVTRTAVIKSVILGEQERQRQIIERQEG